MNYYNSNTTYIPQEYINDDYEIEIIRIRPKRNGFTSFGPRYNNPCLHCSNNPANGGSGICNCILGSINNLTW